MSKSRKRHWTDDERILIRILSKSGTNTFAQFLLCIILFANGSLSSSPSFFDPKIRRPLGTTTMNQRNKELIDLGTTIVAIQYRDGVVVGADTRTSVSSSFVSHRYATKIVKITETCVLCRSGSSADTQMIARSLSQYTMDHYYQYNSIGYLSIQEMSNWLRRQIVTMKEQNGDDVIKMSLIVAGYDPNTQTPQIYSIAQSGALLTEHDFAVSGSGSTYIVAHLDDFFHTQRKKMKHIIATDTSTTMSQQSESSLLEEGDAVRLCAKSIQMAIHRDGSSGGIICLYIINKDGIREVSVLPPSSSLTTTTTPKTLPGFANRKVEKEIQS